MPDFLFVLHSLSGNTNGCNPKLVMLARQRIHRLVSDLNINFIIAWIPEHAKIPGKIPTYLLAKNPLSYDELNIVIRPTT